LRSDAQKTLRDIEARRDIPSPKKKKLRSLFGKLELRYTRTRLHARAGTFVSISRFTVVAKDSSSTAIVIESPLTGLQISHIHFEGDYYWIHLGSGKIREFFKRIK
jgi:hypothetical protein